jgi:hypothetical protein
MFLFGALQALEQFVALTLQLGDLVGCFKAVSRSERFLKLFELIPQFSFALFQGNTHAMALRTKSQSLSVDFGLLLIDKLQCMLQTTMLLVEPSLVSRQLPPLLDQLSMGSLQLLP